MLMRVEEELWVNARRGGEACEKLERKRESHVCRDQISADDGSLVAGFGFSGRQ